MPVDPVILYERIVEVESWKYPLCGGTAYQYQGDELLLEWLKAVHWSDEG